MLFIQKISTQVSFLKIYFATKYKPDLYPEICFFHYAFQDTLMVLVPIFVKSITKLVQIGAEYIGMYPKEKARY